MVFIGALSVPLARLYRCHAPVLELQPLAERVTPSQTRLSASFTHVQLPVDIIYCILANDYVTNHAQCACSVHGANWTSSRTRFYSDTFLVHGGGTPKTSEIPPTIFGQVGSSIKNPVIGVITRAAVSHSVHP